MISTFRTLWRRRTLIRALTVSNLRTVHRNTFLGYLWWLIDPIMMTAVYAVIVGFIFKRGGFHRPYPAFIMCGVVFSKSFSSTVTQAVNSISRNEGLVKSYSFPKAALPVSLVLSGSITFVFALVPVLLLVFFYQFVMGESAVNVNWTLVYLPLLLAVQFTITLGAALMFSCFGVFFKDLGNIMTHVLRVVWYLSAGLYAISDIVGGYDGLLGTDWSRIRSYYLLNPFAHIMEGYRSAILYGRTPDLAGLAFAFCVGVLWVFVGLRIFQSKERKFTKFI